MDIAEHLPASGTHRDRRYTYFPRADRTSPGDGKLTVVQGKEVDSYLLEEQEPIGFAGRVFLLCKQDDSAEVYEAAIQGPRRTNRCTCTAGRVKRHRCKHVDVLLDMIAKGHLPARQRALAVA